MGNATAGQWLVSESRIQIITLKAERRGLVKSTPPCFRPGPWLGPWLLPSLLLVANILISDVLSLPVKVKCVPKFLPQNFHFHFPPYTFTFQSILSLSNFRFHFSPDCQPPYFSCPLPASQGKSGITTFSFWFALSLLILNLFFLLGAKLLISEVLFLVVKVNLLSPLPLNFHFPLLIFSFYFQFTLSH